MYKKDYEKFAELFAEFYSELPRAFCTKFIDILKQENFRFDKFKFITRVGILALEKAEQKKLKGE